jgi:hypothetical protein
MTIERSKGWRNRLSLDGGSSSTHVVVSDISEIEAVRQSLLASEDTSSGAVNGLLKCMSVETRYGTGSDDPAGNKATTTAEFVLAWKVDALDPAAAFAVRYNYSADGFTYNIKYPKAKWESGDPVTNREVMPRKTISITEAILFGVRLTAGLNTYSQWTDKVNSDTFLGGAPGHVLFKGGSADPFQLPDGRKAFKHQVTVAYRSIEWNKDYREDGTFAFTGGWEYILPDGKNRKFEAVSFAGLLNPP